MKLNRIFAVAGAILTLSVGLAFAKKDKIESNKLKVVTTIFPEYDWAKEIIGNNSDAVDLTLLINNGVDMHSWSPSVKDIAKISEADIFVYVGGESDDWVESTLKNAKNKNMKVVNLLEVLGDRVKTAEIVEGMEHDHDEHHHDEDGHHHDDEDDEEEELDEHVWLSLRNAQILCEAICDVLSEKDPANAVFYKANLIAYNKKLSDLDAKYTAAVKTGSRDTLLFGDRFPFRYLVDDYKLKYYAAFAGCSAESEASFKTIAFLAEKLNELDLNYVCQIESSNGKIAKTIISTSKNKKAKVVTLDSLQSTTAKQIKKGASYLGAMEQNLLVVKEALK